MRPGRALRGIRAAVFAAVCVLLAAVGHAHAGEPAPLSLALPALFVLAAVSWTAAGGRRGTVAVTAAAVGSQAALHLLFTLGAPGHSPAPHGEHAAHAHLAAGHSPAVHDAAGGGPLGLSLAMAAVHLLAALVSGWWLAQGERAVFRLLARTGARLTVRRVVPAPPPALPGLRAPAAYAAPSRARLLLHSLISRGPPRGRAVA
ncbi:hypothetical protein [Streptomyces lonarensis]|uniref:Integral membrane protein n=1 Tax=Streptomyces lonarensis TaxID=700599 RepID=A0A7X6CY92_9ACTN|nr:hypothetical protein [Streptomyces lonarensis]NJQ04779.1 hypothetical protein [Streptomyces lonarensis]